MKNYLLQFRILFTILFSTSISIPAVQAQNWAQVLKAVAADREDKNSSGRSANDNFGYSVAISGSYAVVGAMNEDEDEVGGNTYENAGAAYLFYNDGNTWKKVKKLVASNRFIGSNFGSSVAIDGDYIVVGAYNDSYGPTMRMGSAYIFQKDQGGIDNWGEVKKITSPLRNENDYFGISVSINKDYVIVGANGEDQDQNELNTVNGAGAAYIFKKDFGSPNNWGFIQKINAVIRGEDDSFGRSVSISGDIVVVGAYQEDEDQAENNPVENSGSAYVFKKDVESEHWSFVKKITASERSSMDIFGFSVAIRGDNIIVGAPGDSDQPFSDNSPMAGAAYIFNKDAGGSNSWGQVKKLVAFDRFRGDNFGASVSISENIAIVGSYFDSEDSLGANTVAGAGSSYIFRKDKDGIRQWGLSQKVTSINRNIGNALGFSVAIDGNYAIASAPLEKLDGIGMNKSINGAGSAHIFYSDPVLPDAWHAVKQIAASTDARSQYFGISISAYGAYAIVGAANGGEQNNGAAYILQNVSGSWKQIRKLTAPSGFDYDSFGQSVSMSLDYAVVGAYNKGRLYVFKKDAGGENNWGLVKEIPAPPGTSLFGQNVSISGDNIITGTSFGDSGFGSAHIYNKNYGGTDNWGHIQTIAPSILKRGDQFGVAVCIVGDTLVVGAASDGPDAPGGFVKSGAAYIFAKNPRETGNWQFVKKLVSADREEGDSFGTTVSMAGSHVFVGAKTSPTDATGGGIRLFNAGAIYMFRNYTNGYFDWLQTKKITAPVRSAYANFGNTIASNDRYAVVGARAGAIFDDHTEAIYIVKNNGYSSWDITQKIQPSTLSPRDYFNLPFAISGKYIFAGSPYSQEDAAEKNTISDAGAAYIFMDNTPLPVTLSSFEVKKSENQARLTWTTTSETNSDYFEIQKSQDGVSWETIGNISAATQSELLKNYVFTDARPYSGENLYRLKMVDTDQKFAYSRIKSVSFDGFGIAVFPNPVVNRFFFTGSEISRIASVNIINSQGTVVGKYNKITTDGIDTAHLAAGTYLVRINKTDGSTQINKIAIVH